MKSGTLIVSRALHLHSRIKAWFEALGFRDVTVTGAAKDGLNFVINEVKPRLLLISSRFYEAGTPYMVGELHKNFPALNIAVVSVCDYPASLAVWFMWHGAKSYINLWEGYDEFYRGLEIIRDGGEYISPRIQHRIDESDEWPNVDFNITKRHMECLILLCCGFIPEHIGEVLHISRRTVNAHLAAMYNMFHCKSREEMVALAWQLELITKEDIQFYDHKTIDFPLPGWAEEKINISRRIVRYGA